MKGKEGELRVYWSIQQVLRKPFSVSVKDIEQAKLIITTLAKYDKYQYENNVKPDNHWVARLEVFDNGGWSDWEDEVGDGIEKYID